MAALGNDIEEYLEVSIEDDDTILCLIRGATSVADVVDQTGILQYIKDWNEEYCQVNDLCPICRAKLVETFQEVPYGDTTVRESEGLSCPVCG